MKTPIDSTEPSPTIDAFDDFGARADEAVVLDDHRVGLQRLEHAADADAAREMHVLADLRAGADGRPGVDHGALVDIGADVDEARHQHDALARCRRRGARRARHGAEAGVAEAVLAPALELRRHLVPPGAPPGPPSTIAVVVEAEREQHRLLEPLVDAAIRRRSSRRRAPCRYRAARAPRSTASRTAPFVAGCRSRSAPPRRRRWWRRDRSCDMGRLRRSKNAPSDGGWRRRRQGKAGAAKGHRTYRHARA